MKIEILKWQDYNGRKDITNPTWFRISNRLFFDPDWDDMSGAEIAVWVYLLSHASFKSSGVVEADENRIAAKARVPVETVVCALEKLEKHECIQLSEVDVTSTLRIRNAYVPKTTDITDIHNITPAYAEPVSITEKPKLVPPLDDSPTILESISQIIGKRLRPLESNLKFIRARLSDGASADDLIDVARIKTHQWKDDPQMRKYLRAETLFNATKFEGYLGEVYAAREREKLAIEVFGA